MQLTRETLRKLVEEVLNEQPPTPPKKKPQPPQGGEGETTKKLKINIPDSPFKPDVDEVINQLQNILKTWVKKEYPSDEIRWKMYHNDIAKLLKQIAGETDEV